MPDRRGRSDLVFRGWVARAQVVEIQVVETQVIGPEFQRNPTPGGGNRIHP